MSTAQIRPAIFTPYGDPDPAGPYLAPTSFLDYDHPTVAAFAEAALAGATTEVDKAVRLF